MSGHRVWVSQTCPGNAERPAWSSQLLHRPSSKTSGLHPAGFIESHQAKGVPEVRVPVLVSLTASGTYVIIRTAGVVL